MNNSLGNFHVRFLAGVGGRVTPTSYILQIFNKRILVDCGIDKDGLLSIPDAETIDAVLLSHAHIDHIGSILYFFLSNKHCRIFIPEGSKRAMRIALLRTHEIQSRKTKDVQEYKESGKWLQTSKDLLTKYMNNFDTRDHQYTPPDEGMNRTGRKKISVAHEDRQNVIITTGAVRKQNRLHAKKTLTTRLGLESYDLDSMTHLRELAEQDKIKFRGTIKHIVKVILDARIDATYKQKMKNLTDDHIITKKDVEDLIKKLEELPLGKFHRIIDERNDRENSGRKKIEVMPLNSGHLYSTVACMWYFRAENGKKVVRALGTGDVGNETLPYPYPKMDISPLKLRNSENGKNVENKEEYSDEDSDKEVRYQQMDCIMTEGTYGHTWRHEYEIGMKDFEKVLIDAIQNKKDVIIPIISLDRPIYGMWEIVTRLFEGKSEAGKKAGIKPKDVDILYAGQDLQGFFPVGDNNVMFKKIRKHWQPLEKDRILHKKGKKPRFIFIAGGFMHPEMPSAKIMLKSLRIRDTQVVVINYCGEKGSNGDNLISGKPFKVIEKLKNHETIERTLCLSGEQKGHRIGGISGHADSETIVGLIDKVSKKGTKVFIHHSGPGSGENLKKNIEKKLREKKLEVLLPRKGKPYPIKQIKEK